MTASTLLFLAFSLQPSALGLFAAEPVPAASGVIVIAGESAVSEVHQGGAFPDVFLLVERARSGALLEEHPDLAVAEIAEAHDGGRRHLLLEPLQRLRRETGRELWYYADACGGVWRAERASRGRATRFSALHVGYRFEGAEGKRRCALIRNERELEAQLKTLPTTVSGAAPTVGQLLDLSPSAKAPTASSRDLKDRIRQIDEKLNEDRLPLKERSRLPPPEVPQPTAVPTSP